MGQWDEQLQQFAKKHKMEIPPEAKGKSKAIKEDKKRHIENISPDRKACAPYNFIPLNESVIDVVPFKENDKYDEERLTGYIDCKLETLTPIYIRGCLTENEVKEGKEAKDKSDFFSPNGKFRIPGSSLRGMVRTLVEIVSWSKFSFFEDRGLYFRGLADRSNLRDEYQEKMVNKDDYYYPKIKAGFLRRDGHNYKIIPSKEDSNGCQIYRLLFNKHTKVVKGLGKRLDEFDYEVVYFQQVAPTLHPHKRFDKKKGKVVDYQLKYAQVTSVSATQDKDHPTKGFLVSSGLFGDKKHMHWLINEPAKKEIPIPECDIENYKRDEERKDEANLLKMPQKYPEGIPCFYIEWKDTKDTEDKNHVSFGHTGMFRLAYKKSIGEFLQDETKQDETKIDMAEAIFGKAAKKEEDSFASRVFFEDAFLSNGDENPVRKEDIPQILSTPKPTTFQHYLVQDSDDIHNLKHYNSNTVIRGNKLYWHKSGENWEETKITFSDTNFNKMLDDNSGINKTDFGDSLTERNRDRKVDIDLLKLPDELYPIILDAIGKYETQHTKIQPIANTEFKFYIRFENLSEIELGALLFALNLPEGCAHKIGMGKPIGLGSIKITPTLNLSDRKKRYQSLFDGNIWSLPSIKNDKTIQDYISAFGSFILSKINANEKGGVTSLWDTYRLRQLKTMLNIEEGKGLDKSGKIEYMPIEKFGERKVLPIPEKVGVGNLYEDCKERLKG